MTDIKALISRLSDEAKAMKPLQSPGYWGIRLIAVLALYGVGVQCFLGFRPDLSLQFTRPYFSSEILLLAALLFSSITSVILTMYPDAYQKPKLLMLPYGIFLLLISLLIVQLFLPADARMVMPSPGTHSMECALCIASVALVPSALLFLMLRKGATIRHYQSGAFAVLAASSVGCLTLRLSEAIDFMPHLLVWHYFPTLLFAAFGAALGKWLLKW